MKKRLIALLLAALMILSAGCMRKKNQNPTGPAVTEVTATEEIIPTETLHPALTDNIFDDENGNPIEEETVAATESATEPAEETKAPTEPAETTAPAAKSTEPAETEDNGEMTYEKFMALGAAEQQAYMNSAESIEAFFNWFDAAKKEYEESRNEIEIGDGSFNLDELTGGNG